MTQKKHPSMTDQQLSQHLASLREEVAAPADFRAKLMLRLQQEGLIQGQPVAVVVQATFWERLLASLTPARLAMAAAAVVALVFVLPKAPQAPVAGVASQAAAPQAASPSVAASGQALVKARTKEAVKEAVAGAQAQPAQAADIASAPRPKTETMPDAILDKSAPVQEQAAVGSSVVTQPSQSSHISMADASAAPSGAMPGAGIGVAGASAPGAQASSASVVAKPTIVVVDPTQTPVVKALQGNSELRGNVIRASQGGSAVLLYKVLKAGHVHIEIHDRLGKLVTVLKDEDQNPGLYELRWAGHDDNGGLAATGIYVLTVDTTQYHAQHKLALVK